MGRGLPLVSPETGLRHLFGIAEGDVTVRWVDPCSP